LATHFVQLSLVHSAASLELPSASRKHRGEGDFIPISKREDREEKADYFTVGGPQFGDTGKRARAWRAQARRQLRKTAAVLLDNLEMVLFETAHSNNGSF